MPKSIPQTTNFPYMLIEYTSYGKSFQRQAVNLEFDYLSGVSFIGLINGGGSPQIYVSATGNTFEASHSSPISNLDLTLALLQEATNALNYLQILTGLIKTNQSSVLLIKTSLLVFISHTNLIIHPIVLH